MIVTNTRLLRRQLMAVIGVLCKPNTWDGRYELVVENGQVHLRPVPFSPVQTSERVGVRS